MYEDDQFRDEPLSDHLKPGDEPKYYDDIKHIHTKDLNDTFLFVYKWRKMIDDYRAQKKIDADILIMTEAYASIEDTMRYYGSPTDENARGAHMPFNFQIIFNTDGNAKKLRDGIHVWLDNMPSNETANWVAGSHDHSRVATRVFPEKIHIANTLVLTLPGASITYYVSINDTALSGR